MKIKKHNPQWLIKNVKPDLKIDRSTKVASIGSCFAREIKNYLQKKGYNYIVKRELGLWNKVDELYPDEHASVAWERVYNTFALRQIVDYTFFDSLIDRRFEDGRDLLRTRVHYNNKETAIKDTLNHIRLSREVFEEAEVLIITLGLTEIWKDDIVAACNDHKRPLPDRFTPIATNFIDNYYNLTHVRRVLKRFNPGLKILLTVSPVPLRFTFRDIDIETANCASKSILRAVADEVSRLDDVYYFPSYEMAGLSDDIVADIMKMFKKYE